MYRHTWMQIDLDEITDNCRMIGQICGKKFIAVLKANAYGSGDVAVCRAVLKGGADMIAVSSVDEAVMLRNENYTGEMLILGPVDPKDIGTVRRLSIAVPAYSMAWVKKAIHHNCAGLKVHLKIDTGMNRIGYKTKEEAKDALELLEAAGCQIEGIFTHFCCSDSDQEMTDRQYAKFRETAEYLNYPFKWIHCDNSDATLYFKDDLSNACRVGIAMYGVSSFSSDLNHPLSLYSEVTHVKTIKAGETVGYGATYTAAKDEIIATIPIGYADGFIRANQGRRVYVDGQYAEVVGRVCMDQCMVRLDHEVPLGTTCEIFGRHIPLEKMAEELNTIPYEIICLISDRVTRRYVSEEHDTMEENGRLMKSEMY